MAKIILIRSFSQTKQKAQFEPINSFCSVSMEFETLFDAEAEMEKVSANLDRIVIDEVEKTIAREMEPPKVPCAVCGGIPVYGGKGLNEWGVCTACERSAPPKQNMPSKVPDEKKVVDGVGKGAGKAGYKEVL